VYAYWLSVVDSADQERRAVKNAGDTNQDTMDVRHDAEIMRAALKAARSDGNVDAFLPALHTTPMVRG
jgi:uncharacterized membrane protein YebE (DUF533 family)